MDFRKQYKKDHPETIGETDSAFDDLNYIDWLEKRLTDVVDSVSSSSSIVLAEKYAEENRDHVLKCRIEKDSLAKLGLYLGFKAGYQYLIDKLKLGDNLTQE